MSVRRPHSLPEITENERESVLGDGQSFLQRSRFEGGTRKRRQTQRLIDEVQPAPSVNPFNIDHLQTVHARQRRTRQQIHSVEYIGYDKISHHVLTHFPNHAEGSRYEWQPILSIIHEIKSRNDGSTAEEKENLLSLLIFKINNFLEEVYPNDIVPDHLWTLPRHPASDYGFVFDDTRPFVGYIPTFKEFDFHDSLYKNTDMVVYCVHPDSNQGENCFGITSVDSLVASLAVEHQITPEANAYAGTIRLKLMSFVRAMKQRVESVLIKYACEKISEREMNTRLFNIMGGNLGLTPGPANPSHLLWFSDQNQRLLIDTTQKYPIGPYRLLNFVKKKTEYYKEEVNRKRRSGYTSDDIYNQMMRKFEQENDITADLNPADQQGYVLHEAVTSPAHIHAAAAAFSRETL